MPTSKMNASSMCKTLLAVCQRHKARSQGLQNPMEVGAWWAPEPQVTSVYVHCSHFRRRLTLVVWSLHYEFLSWTGRNVMDRCLGSGSPPAPGRASFPSFHCKVFPHFPCLNFHLVPLPLLTLTHRQPPIPSHEGGPPANSWSSFSTGATPLSWYPPSP